MAEKPEKFVCLDRAFAGNDQLKANTALQTEFGEARKGDKREPEAVRFWR